MITTVERSSISMLPVVAKIEVNLEGGKAVLRVGIKNPLKGYFHEKKYVLPPENSFLKKGTGIRPVPYLLHRRVIDIPETREGYCCDRRVNIVERVCLDLF